MRWKWIALIGVVLIGALAASAYLVLRTYDYTKLKPRIERMVTEATGRELTLSGEVDLEFGLAPVMVGTEVALANAPWASDPQMITARRIEARVRLLPLLKNLEKDEKEPGPEPGELESRPFSNTPLPFDVLKQVDADVSLNAKNVRARDANFEFGSLILTLENGDLNVDTLQATYKQTRISGNFHLYPEPPPRAAAKFLVQDFDLGGLLREMRLNEEVRSHLDTAVDVNSSGGSMHDLMAGLDGSAGAVMGEGYLTRYLDLLSVDLTRKVFQFWASTQKAPKPSVRWSSVRSDCWRLLSISAPIKPIRATFMASENRLNSDVRRYVQVKLYSSGPLILT